MVHITFYEKPGCGGNARQKARLRAAHHTLDVRDILHWPWTRASLLAFFAPLPVTDWFNRSAPRVKSGELVPEALNADAALALLLAEPLLIRRPLMEVGERRMVGFEVDRVHGWIGLGPTAPAASLEGCTRVPQDGPSPASPASPLSSV